MTSNPSVRVRARAALLALAGVMVIATTVSGVSDAGFVVRMEGTWTVGPPPGTPLVVGEVVVAGAWVHPPEGCTEENEIVIALYHRAQPLRASCGGPRGRTPVRVEGGSAGSLTARVLRAVQGRFLDHGNRYQPTAARDERTPATLRLQSAVLARGDAGMVAVPTLSIEGTGEGEVTYSARRIDDQALLGPVDAALTITVRRSNGSEQITAPPALGPGLYNIWDKSGLDRRESGTPATLGTWVLVVTAERAVLQVKFREAVRGITWNAANAVDRTSVLRAYLMHLGGAPED